MEYAENPIKSRQKWIDIMINQEFQELKRQYGVKAGNMATIISKMKENLTLRNGGKDEYVFGYTQTKTVIISECKDVTELFAIDGDMNPLGL